ncbi:cohesin complex subunit psm1 [Vararia minispora EC-137]|uniref:Cohesin complex subunit psm1 n=1 Tax=Vararia minispora EC-137 TaxID=1314806 RepID=A0ACB8Q9Y4_9AGAM|nr:cohesin complex subunit psm1 [Vararia minispora EC-137]
MPLIQIEVCDFKSYRGHQVVGPFRHFTSVIGPNGAGKSNLMDAISFVLGVKSAQLRSSQLKDLVYRGRRLARDSEAGPSGSADLSRTTRDEEEEEGEGEGTAKKAWVRAVYEDQNKKTWTFQRTISVMGSSEYRLNNKVVNYSTYNDKLIEHNILVKAKNFLVFQGDVEAVAQQSPRDLTRLIEQISGSLELEKEYEAAKLAQERATENATTNFTKRRGITGEIKQYKEQKTEADRFEALMQERDELVLRRVLYKLWHIEEALGHNAEEIQERSKALVGLRDNKSVADKALENARKDQATARSAVTAKEKRLKKAERQLEARKPDLAGIEAQIAHAVRKRDQAHNAREHVARDVNRHEVKLQALLRDLRETQRAADQAQEQQREASQNNFSLSEESLEEYRRLRAQANVLAVDERQELEMMRREEKGASRAYTHLKDKQEELEQRKETLGEDNDTLANRHEELKNKVDGLQTNLNKVKQDLENQQSERLRIAQLEQEVIEKFTEVSNKLMAASLDRHESEREAKLKETLLNLQKIFPGVRGRLVDLCKPTQRKFETAIAVVLGRNIDAVVVDEEKTAIDCIEYMRNQRAGIATFIPLDSIQVKPINDKFRSFAKGSRLAIDVIQYEPVIERAIHHACGNALVCDTMDIAKYVCYEKQQEVKAVTLEGTVIHKSGLITGGRGQNDNGSKKWDEKDYQGLIRVRDSLQDQLRELQQSKPRTSDENLTSEMARLESALQVARDDLRACKSKLDGVKKELKATDKSLRENNPALRKARTTLDALVEKTNGLAAIIDDAEGDVFRAFCDRIGVANIREYEERQLKVAQEESEARMLFDTQIARLTHQSQFEEEQLTTQRERLQRIDETTEIEEANIEKHTQTLAETQAEIDTAQEEIKALQGEMGGLKEALEEKGGEVDEAKRAVNKATKALDLAEKEISSRNDEIERLGLERGGLYRKCRLEEIDLPLEEGSLKDNLREEVAMDVDDSETQPKRVSDYGIEVDFSLLEDEEREDESPDARLKEFDADIAKLGAEIERMAPNMKAMERLDDVQARLAAAESEADKARKESKDARDAFNDVKQRRTDLFNSAYTHISERIDSVYKELTKGRAAPMGGVAYLSVEDSEEPYIAGVKYHAMPPMKRFRDMEQLSGGEKTIAALALLFAIHSYQPSPFFVLDEVDAALDNTNVAKIANYIRKHASESFQFIVISLKASLYERGESLVGIYRDQDVNSSRTLTLGLAQYDD